VPSLARARFLVPVSAGRAAEAAFTDHLTTVSRRSRLYGRLIARAFGTGMASHVLRDQLIVGIDSRIPREEWRYHLVLHHLSAELQAPDLVAMHPVRRATPNAKPTLRLFGADGQALGHAKIGWSSPTRRLVRAEVNALDVLSGGVGGMVVPKVLAVGRWFGLANQDLQYVVTTALPRGLRPWKGTPESDAGVLHAVAATGDCASGPLRRSAYAESVRERLELAAAAQPLETAALQQWFARLVESPDLLRYGRWHGDWVPWNLAQTPTGGAVWDWEYSAASVPIGFDLCHWYFQGRLAARNGSLDTAAAELGRHVAKLGALGVPQSAWRLVADMYVLEMLVRATGLAAGGSGWNRKLHPRLIRYALDQGQKERRSNQSSP
jgi:hypothetical protein